jgi:hypothetical protein
MFRDDTSPMGNLLGTLFMAGFYYVARESGKQDALKQIEDKNKDAEIERLRRQLNDYKRKYN